MTYHDYDYQLDYDYDYQPRRPFNRDVLGEKCIVRTEGDCQCHHHHVRDERGDMHQCWFCTNCACWKDLMCTICKSKNVLYVVEKKRYECQDCEKSE